MIIKLVKGLALGSFFLGILVSLDAADWTQWRGSNRDGTWKESGILQTIPETGLRVQWRIPIGPGFSSPVVVNRSVFVTDVNLIRPKAIERVRRIDATNGRVIWSHTIEVEYPEWAYNPGSPEGPRSTPIFSEGRLFSVGRTGHLSCLNSEDGKVVWQKDLKTDYSAKESSFTSSPLIQGRAVIVVVGAEPGPCVVAFDRDSGEELWRAVNEPAVYSSPILVQHGGKPQLILATLKSITSLDPVNGTVFWSHPIRTTRDMSVPTPVFSDGYLFVNGVMLKLDHEKTDAWLLWPQDRPPSRNTISNTSTGLMIGDFLYISNLMGHLLCMERETGKVRWETDKPTPSRSGSSIHLTSNDASLVLFNDLGELLLARISPEGYAEAGRFQLLAGTYPYGDRKVAWTPPSFSQGHVFARNDEELVCASLLSSDYVP